MADLGDIGFYAGHEATLALATDFISLYGTVRERGASIYNPQGGCAGLGGVVTLCSPSSRQEDLRAQQRVLIVGTQYDGVPTPATVHLYANKALIAVYQSTPDLILNSANPNMEYEIAVLGNDVRRTEVWGPSTISYSGPQKFSLTGELDPCTSSVAYSSGLTVNGSWGTNTWDVYGSLPAGLSFSTATGVISGTTAATGSYQLDIGVTSFDGKRIYRTVTLVVS